MAITPWAAEVAAITNGLSIKIYTPADLPPTGKFVAIYGDPGVGKTFLTESLVKCEYTRPMLYLDLKGGAWVFSKDADVHIIPIQEYKEFSTISMNLAKMNRLPFKSIVIDHGTELQALNVINIMGQKPGVVSGSGNATQGQYGMSTAQMLNVFRLYKDLAEKTGVHVIILVQQDARKDSVTNQIVKAGIGFTPSLARSFPAIADIVGHLTVQNDPPYYTRVLNFAKTAHSDAKFRRRRTEAAYRIPLTIAYRDQPVLADIFNTLVGEKDWPEKNYSALANKAKVEYATVVQDSTPSVVENAVAAHAGNEQMNGDSN